MKQQDKAKRPIYKRAWPYIAAFVVAAAIFGGTAESEKPEDSSVTLSKPEEVRSVQQATTEPEEVRSIQESQKPDEISTIGVTEIDSAPTRSAPEVQQSVEETTQEITEGPAEEPAEEITQDPAEEVPAEEQELEQVSCSDGLYRTPSGKRYHKSKACAGENAIPCTLEEASSLGLTLCDTCKDY